AQLKAMKAAAAQKKTGPSKAALQKVADLEARLEALEASWAAQVEALRKEREALDAREAREQAAHEAERVKLSEQLEKARAALA
ncbi:MAG: hypothetical protein ACM3W4_12285, partial [Ignavibacteriales bacterium]